MGSLSAATELRLPVRLDGNQVGRPVDVLLEPDTWRAVGFLVHCRDDVRRMLPYAAARLDETEIAVDSAAMLLDDVGFYHARSESLRGLLGAEVGRGRRSVGILRDVLLGSGGVATELEVERDGELVRIDPDGASVASPRASAA
ncbi:MAG TPA: hypothetical protein VJ986_02625 [Gaiellaceae bacterium]|nr:hypothetical protein [Gaiellaceae bacterium]